MGERQDAPLSQTRWHRPAPARCRGAVRETRALKRVQLMRPARLVSGHACPLPGSRALRGLAGWGRAACVPLAFRPEGSWARDRMLARILASGTEGLILYDGSAVESVKSSWATTRTASGLMGNVQTYSFRHTVARWLRKQSVPAWDVAAQLGHKAPDYSTTDIYAPFDPAYLTKTTAAIDLFVPSRAPIARQFDVGILAKRGLMPCFQWCRLRDSNSRPSDYKSDALPAELNRRLEGCHYFDRRRGASGVSSRVG